VLVGTKLLCVTPGLPHLNEPAPDCKAKTTHGDRSLSDYQGKRLILFSHPADFTPVCSEVQQP
jgi:peroxiredoxin (alkyl hydroperoxide reductase subunit C)